ncbi:hypothetical protein LINPERPRIM_LOCUS21465 [Linum perenne]
MRSGFIWVAWIIKYMIKSVSLFGFEGTDWFMALEAAHETQAGYSTLLPPRVEGTHLWNGDPMHVFKVSRAWNDITAKFPSVCCNDLVWSGYTIPRRCFVAWFIVSNRIAQEIRS